MKDLKLKQNEVVHCPTEELAEAVLRIAHDFGYAWNDGNSFLIYTKYVYYEDYEDQICYNINKGRFCSVSYYKVQKYQIITADEFLQRHKAPTPTLAFPRVMEVSRNGNDWYKRVVSYYNDTVKGYLAYDSFEDINELDKAINNNKPIYIVGWNHAREIPETINLTKQEIADKLGLDVNFLNITD